MSKTLYAAAGCALALSGCVTIGDKTNNDWYCNDPYLSTQVKHFGTDELKAARNGYMYAVAAALALQGTGQEDRDNWFSVPRRMTPVEAEPFHGTDGFQAMSFILRSKDSDPKKDTLVIAFTGSQTSDFWNDWIKTNILGSRSQHDQARAYFKKLAAQYPQIKHRVVSGFSMGGALAAHVGLNPETSSSVKEIWAFNPSLRIHDDRTAEEIKITNAQRDSRFWLVSNHNEIVKFIRQDLLQILPGFGWIPAPGDQFTNQFELANTGPITAHYRYVLARNILWAAEFDARANNQPDNEPLEILRASNFSACKKAGNVSVAADS